jgi:EKC/KEOPS complex subunit CGI121/TPRKB
VKVSRNEEPSAESIAQHLSTNVEGEQMDPTDENISTSTDLTKISKYYKLNGLNWVNSIKDKTARNKELEMLILGSMAIRGV